MPYRLLQRYLRYLIRKERKRQIALGYTAAHDLTHYELDNEHLFKEAYIQYCRGHFIHSLALLDAQASVHSHNFNNRRTN